MENAIPLWLRQDFWSVLTAGEIYPQIRAIAVRYDKVNGYVCARFYFDRTPTEFDFDSVDIILTLLAAKYPEGHEVKKITEECVLSIDPIKDPEALGGFVYTRREYEVFDNPNVSPNYF